MKNIIAIFIFLTLPLTASAAPLSTVTACNMSDDSQLILLQKKISSAENELFLQSGDKIEKAFLDMPDHDFLGEIVLAKCFEHTLIFALNYGSPYLKGVVIRKNPLTHADERIYFSEKTLPSQIYIDEKGMQLVIKNSGGETDKKYIIYQYISGQGQPEESQPSDTLPPVTDQTLISLE